MLSSLLVQGSSPVDFVNKGTAQIIGGQAYLVGTTMQFTVGPDHREGQHLLHVFFENTYVVSSEPAL